MTVIERRRIWWTEKVSEQVYWLAGNHEARHDDGCEYCNPDIKAAVIGIND